MSIFPFSSFFKKNKKQLTVPDTILIKRLKKLFKHTNLLIFKDVNIYHHTDSYDINLIVIDNLRGLYLFETKEWTFDELKSATIQKAKKQNNSSDTLAFDNTHSIIHKKFNELMHNDGVAIFNYLLMENLTTNEYKHLNNSFKELLPQEKIIFSDSLETDILKKLQSATQELKEPFNNNTIVGTLFVQYAVLNMYHEIHLASEEQRNFVDETLQELNYLQGEHGSGKSSILLLKAIVEILKDKSQKIIIIKPTLLACDLLKKRLLEIVEHAIIEINLTSIEILTPLELVNRHHVKLNREKISSLNIDTKLLHKTFFAADLIFCDDAYLLPQEFIDYLKRLQKEKKLLLVNDTSSEPTQETIKLTKNFRNINKKVSFYKTNPHAKAMHLIAKLLQNSATHVVVVSNTLSREKLKDDLNTFIKEKAQTLQSNTHLINQKFGKLLLCGYEDLNAIETDHIILMDLGFLSKNEIEYAFHLSTKSVAILYEEDSQEIKNLRNSNE